MTKACNWIRKYCRFASWPGASYPGQDPPTDPYAGEREPPEAIGNPQRQQEFLSKVSGWLTRLGWDDNDLKEPMFREEMLRLRQGTLSWEEAWNLLDEAQAKSIPEVWSEIEPYRDACQHDLEFLKSEQGDEDDPRDVDLWRCKTCGEIKATH
jgi:hypothetical protein